LGVSSTATVTDMDLLHLRYFVAVAEERNFARAAGRLHMAASPLSQRIKDLERELGTALFLRAHHRIDLTAAGEALLGPAIEILDRFDALPELVREVTDSTLRPALIGIAPDVSTPLRDGLLALLADRYPDISARLVPTSTEPQILELRAGRIDLALVHDDVAGRGIRTVLLERQPVGVAVGRDTAMGKRTSIRLGELAEVPFAAISYDAAPVIYRDLDDLLNRLGVHKRITLSGDNVAALAHLVETGQAFSLVSVAPGATSRVFDGDRVTILAIDGMEVTRSTFAAWRENRAASNNTVADLVAVVMALAVSDTASDSLADGDV
jgi:LysR family transcriptional regulator, benzoate and cis,cis-muconate-responsive activator of ben and cat genes